MNPSFDTPQADSAIRVALVYEQERGVDDYDQQLRACQSKTFQMLQEWRLNFTNEGVAATYETKHNGTITIISDRPQLAVVTNVQDDGKTVYTYDSLKDSDKLQVTSEVKDETRSGSDIVDDPVDQYEDLSWLLYICSNLERKK